MSLNALAWAWDQTVKPASAKLVLLCLADAHNRETGRCDPSAKYIAKQTGLDKKTVKPSLDKLVELDLICIQNRPGKSPEFLLDLPQNRVTPKTGVPENGVTRKRAGRYPENGVGGTPKSGYEPGSNQEGTVKESADKPRRFVASEIDLPDGIHRGAWLAWCQNRSKRRKPISEDAATAQLKFLAEYSLDEQQHIVRTSIQNDYQGLFPPKGFNHANTKGNHGAGQDTRRLSGVERTRLARERQRERERGQHPG